MKCQILFPGKNKKNITNLSAAELAQRVVMVKLISFILEFHQICNFGNGCQTSRCGLEFICTYLPVFFQKSVPCTACIPSTNRYTILESRESRRFFLEHLVRVGDQRDVRCKKCEAASIAYIQVGPCK